MVERVAQPWVGACLAALVGVVLVVPDLVERSFWLDESVSVTLSSQPWGEFSDVVRAREVNMSLYHLLLRPWVALGEAEAWVRLLSLAAALASLPLVYRFGARLFDARVGALAAALLALNPVWVEYAGEARGYALALLLTTAASLLFVRAVEVPTSGRLAAYVLVAGLAPYAHLFVAFVLLAHALSLLLVRRPLPLERFAAAAGALGLLLVPLAVMLVQSRRTGIEWAAGNAAGRLVVGVRERVPVLVALVVVVLAAAAAVWAVRRLRRSAIMSSTGAWGTAFVVLWLAVPFLAAGLLSYATTPVFVVRYFIVCLPAVVLLLALGIMRLPRPFAAVAVVVALAGSAAAAIVDDPAIEEWEDVVAFVETRAAAGDGVLFYAPYVRIPFELYIEERPAARGELSPLVPPLPWGRGFPTVLEHVPIERRGLSRALGRGERVWLVLSHHALYGDADPEVGLVRSELARDFRLVEERQFDGVLLERWERLPQA